MFYFRKLSNNPNFEKIKNIDDIGDLEADILKQEFATTSNTLSFWKCDTLDNKADTIKAILLATTSIKKSRIFILSDNIIKKYNFIMDDREVGITGYRDFGKLHSNLIGLTYSKIKTVVEMLREAFQDSKNLITLNRQEVKDYIIAVKNANLLDCDKINPNLKHDIDKYC